MQRIDYKILPEYFDEIIKGNKRFELRKDDRNIQPGDGIFLHEWNNTGNPRTSGFTGRYLYITVTYVLRNVPEYGLMPGYCIIGFL